MPILQARIDVLSRCQHWDGDTRHFYHDLNGGPTVHRRCTDGGQPSGEAECRSYPRHLHLQPPEISHWKASVLKSSILRAGGIWRNETPKLWRLVELCYESNQLQSRSSCSDSWWFSSHRNDNSFTDQHQPCRKMSRNLFPRPVFDPKYPRST